MASPVLSANVLAGYRAHQPEIDAAVRRVLEGGWYILGREVEAFEREFAAYVGVGHAIGVGSGTDALHLALRVAGVGPGDLVATVSHTAVATVAAIELCGARPVFIDIDPRTFTLSPVHLGETLLRLHASGRSVKAVIPVHLYGHPARMDGILRLAAQYDLRVIEDCAQSHGAWCEERRTGAWGHLAAFSFYPTKNLGALGDGGAIVTGDAGLAEQVRMVREYGWRERYVSEVAGFNSRLDEIQAAILRARLPALERENARRGEIAALYRQQLAGAPLTLPFAPSSGSHVYHQFVVRASRRSELQAYLKAQGVSTLIHYPVPIHRQPAYCTRPEVALTELPETERAADEVLSLPIYPELTDQEVIRVSELIDQWYQNPPG